ncbi:MAG: T9SS type A sorting domain-containing protein [Bacteroidetes bacterium]|nr:T9SS type A sorting domain-containing protein [Bacteroidota bacterium]
MQPGRKYLVILFFFSIGSLIASPSLELYPNFHTIGVSLRLDAPAPSGASGMLFVSTRQGNGWSTEEQGFELTRVTDRYFASCVFHTEPGKEYRIRAWLVYNKALVANLTDSVFTRAEPSFPVAVRTFYTSPSGTGISTNKLSPGALSQNLLNQLQTGDRVILLAGRYYTGELLLNTSGTANAPIQFIAEGEVILDGGNASPLPWTRASTDTAHVNYNLFYTNLGGVNSNCVVVNGKRLYPYRNLLELSTHSTIRAIDLNGNASGVFKLGLDGFFRDGRNPADNPFPYTAFNPNTYIKFANKSDTSGKDIHVSLKTHAFRLLNAAHVQFRGIHFMYYGAAGRNNYRTALFIENSQHILIDSCAFDFCDHAVSLKGNSSRNTIQHCRVEDDLAKLTYFQFKETGLDYQHLNFNYPNYFPFQARNVEPGRIYFDHGFTGRGNVMRYNFISGGCDGITCPDTPGDSTVARHFDIYGNEFGEGSDDAFELDGNAANMRVWDNVMHGAGNGISVASPCYGPVYIFRNVMYNFRKTIYQYVVNVVTLVTDTIQASPLKLNAGYCDLPGTVYFMHNTVRAGPESHGFVLFQPQSKSSWQKVVAKNNIFYTSSYNFCLWVRATDSVDLDYNNYYNSKGFSARKDRPDYAEYSSLSAAGAGILGNINDPNSNVEKHGYNFNPYTDWVNPKQFDFHLKPGAESMDKGVHIPGLNSGFAGTAPDLGAFEYSSAAQKNLDKKIVKIQLYPNPVDRDFRPQLPGHAFNYSILDPAGKIILTGQNQHRGNPVNVSALAPGMYLFSAQCGEKSYAAFFLKR